MPGSTISKIIVKQKFVAYYWVYILESVNDKKRYIGFATDIKKRIREHNSGMVVSTNYRKPLKLIYAELCLNQKDARRRENYFKRTGGRRFLAKRLKEYYKINNNFE
ncbi:MAG: putative endonuclease [Parcubacteria group bacterium Athens1014_10]|nr:MAG: putative endonuclease [Parcubacteria group bacterium Athens1014_10]TSD05190.1 MAG: putative endonuclease [Parcubacteria group bacterium Athens0714_12]